jgi:hypothetical protein
VVVVYDQNANGVQTEINSSDEGIESKAYGSSSSERKSMLSGFNPQEIQDLDGARQAITALLNLV